MVSQPNGNGSGTPKHHRRRRTIPFAHSTRHKPRRWPLALRFIKGAVHGAIIVPVALHTAFAMLIAYVDGSMATNLGIPVPIIPSLSIVVGLMLVFRNQTSYNRFWDGRNYLSVIITSVRNLTRSFLACSYRSEWSTGPSPQRSRLDDRADTERVVKILIAILYATKNHLRAEWGAAIIPGAAINPNTGSSAALYHEYSDLIPKGLEGLDHQGLGLPLQLVFFVEQYIKRNHDLGYFHAPQASQMSVQLNTLVDAYGRMETIRLTPIPVAHLIHQKQALALFGLMLPFALVDDMGWFTVPLVTLVTFTLYGIDGIGGQLEDPFGYDHNDIKMDSIVEDIRNEITAMLVEWKRVEEDGGGGGEEMFITSRRGGGWRRRGRDGGDGGGGGVGGMNSMIEQDDMLAADPIITSENLV